MDVSKIFDYVPHTDKEIDKKQKLGDFMANITEFCFPQDNPRKKVQGECVIFNQQGEKMMMNFRLEKSMLFGSNCFSFICLNLNEKE